MKPLCPPTHGAAVRCLSTLLRGSLAVAFSVAASSSLHATLPAYNYHTSADQWAAVSGGTGDPSTCSRDCAQYVLEAFAEADFNNATTLDSTTLAHVRSTLACLSKMQDLTSPQPSAVPNPTTVPTSYPSTTYGNFAWSYADVSSPNHVTVNDPNAVEFVVQALVQVPVRFGANSAHNLLGVYPDVATSINDIFTAAAIGVQDHSVSTTYTNMVVTKIWNLAALSQTTGTSSLLTASRTFMNAFLHQTETTGINEFLSPTYTAGDMDSLGFTLLYATDQELRAEAQAALKLFWIDLYANWMNQNQHMGSTHSRTYNFLIEGGPTDRYYFQAGLLTARTPTVWYGMSAPNLYLPVPIDVTTPLSAFPRTILRDWNKNTSTQQFTTTYVNADPTSSSASAPAFSVGSATTRYDDVTFEGFTITPQPKNTYSANFNFNTQGLVLSYGANGDHTQDVDNWYLQSTIPNAAGVEKANTLKPFVVGVQRADEVLFLASSSGINRSTGTYDTADVGTENVQSTIIIPDDATIYTGTSLSNLVQQNMAQLNHYPSTTGTNSYTLPAGTTLFATLNNVTTGIRFLQSTDMNGAPISLTLANDGYGTDDNGNQIHYHSFRVTCPHCYTLPTSTGHGTIAFWSRTAVTPDTTTFNSFCSGLMNGTVTTNSLDSSGNVKLNVAGRSGAMIINANVWNETISSTSGGEPGLAATTTPLFNVNGTEYVTPTLQAWQHGDFGTPTNTNDGTTINNGVYTLTGTGTDIWTGPDGYQYCYQTLTGDGTIVGRLVTFPSSQQAWAKAGLMIRESSAANSPYAFLCLTGNNGARFSTRTAGSGAGYGTAVRGGSSSLTARNLYFKLTRAGNMFSCATSTDGKNWTVLPQSANVTSVEVDMASTVQVGIAVTGFNPAPPAAPNSNGTITATFDNVGVFSGAYQTVLP